MGQRALWEHRHGQAGRARPTLRERAEASSPPLLAPRQALQPHRVGPIGLEAVEDEVVGAAGQDALHHPMLLPHQHIPRHTRHHATATHTRRADSIHVGLMASRAPGTETHV